MCIKSLYKKEIKRVSNRIIGKYQPEKIILFGSCANGKIKRDSDVDMLIIKRSKLPHFRRAQEVYKLLLDLEYKVPFDFLIYTSSEFKERVKSKDFFIDDIRKNGKILYEQN